MLELLAQAHVRSVVMPTRVFLQGLVEARRLPARKNFFNDSNVIFRHFLVQFSGVLYSRNVAAIVS